MGYNVTVTEIQNITKLNFLKETLQRRITYIILVCLESIYY